MGPSSNAGVERQSPAFSSLVSPPSRWSFDQPDFGPQGARRGFLVCAGRGLFFRSFAPRDGKFARCNQAVAKGRHRGKERFEIVNGGQP